MATPHRLHRTVGAARSSRDPARRPSHGSGLAVPLDLGVAPAQVQRRELVRPARTPRARTARVASRTSAATLGGRGSAPASSACSSGGELGRGTAVDAVTGQQEAVRFGARLGREVGDELGGRRAPRSRTPVAPRRAPAGSGRRTPPVGGRRARPRSGGRCAATGRRPGRGWGSPRPGSRSGLRHHLGGGHPDPEPGEEPGAGADRDRREMVEVDAQLPAQVVDRRRQLLGVAATSGELYRAQHGAGVADGDRDLRGRGVEGEDQHVRPPGRARHRPPRRARRGDPPTTRPRRRWSPRGRRHRRPVRDERRGDRPAGSALT